MTKKYSLIVLVLLACLQLFSSCKKTSDIAAADTISATVNGVDETFSVNTNAHLSTGVQLNSNLTMSGSNSAATGADGLSINLAVNKTITTSIYISGSKTTGSVSMTYTHGISSVTNSNAYSTDPGTNTTLISITTLTSTNIQGTFSGQLVQGNVTKTIANGKFNLTLN